MSALARSSRRLLFAVLPSLSACRSSLPSVATPLPTSTAPSTDAYVSNLTGVAFGSVFTRALADGAPSTDVRSSKGDEAVDASVRQDGEELKRSCGSQGIRSHAQATAAFQPLPAGGVRQFGFALSTTAYAKGGAWRKRFVLCGDANNTAAAADARATGRIDLTFNANGGASDQLILRVSGATVEEAHLELRDGQNRLLPLAAVPGATWVATTLADPGPYSVHASIASHAEDAGGGTAHDQRGMNVSVSVQSMRDALTLGYAREPTSTAALPLAVFISTDAMSAALDSALFTTQHRFYPCARVDCGTDRLSDLYLEMPRVGTTGDSVVLDMRLSGSYQIALTLAGGVAGTIRATAVPVVEHDTLRLAAPRVDVATRNLIVKWRSAAFERKLLDRIESVRIDLTPRLQAAVAKAREQFALTWGGACLLVSQQDAHVRSVQVVTAAPQGIVANFGIKVSDVTGSECPMRRAAR